MWFALIFISYLEVSHLQLDLDTVYYNRKECFQAQRKEVGHLKDTLIEYSTPAERMLSEPYVAFNCVKIPLRKS